MRSYEVMYVLNPTLEEEATNALIERFSGIITQAGGEIESVERWGKRRLAYEIDELHEGFYVVTKFRAEKETIEELRRVMKITNEVLRYLLVRQDS
ncbi:MAG: 30S ribosomal protein S6 [Limnochordia bacterium]|jgi:small subunit ribosomal protein S6|nr:30S ribosomal protein S6 [Limnochordia bacterium]MDD2628623.1 30S ribosomal protein S6 [Limnochordia bacterium]MDD2756835.1 30S ribosomal protein S6 [Methanothrix sp.]MDD4516960.1 30S ribosomal protein S6 [Limnochordia bacterium]